MSVAPVISLGLSRRRAGREVGWGRRLFDLMNSEPVHRVRHLHPCTLPGQEISGNERGDHHAQITGRLKDLRSAEYNNSSDSLGNAPLRPVRGIMSWEDHERREQFGRLLGYYRRKAA